MELSHQEKTVPHVLIVSITPYFLEKGNVWFEENLQKILIARKTQAFFQDNTLFLEKDQQYSVSDLKSITPGDYLVHLDHGVGIFDGFTQIQDTKYYILSYAAEDKLFAPIG